MKRQRSVETEPAAVFHVAPALRTTRGGAGHYINDRRHVGKRRRHVKKPPVKTPSRRAKIRLVPDPLKYRAQAVSRPGKFSTIVATSVVLVVLAREAKSTTSLASCRLSCPSVVSVVVSRIGHGEGSPSGDRRTIFTGFPRVARAPPVLPVRHVRDEHNSETSQARLVHPTGIRSAKLGVSLFSVYNERRAGQSAFSSSRVAL